MNSADIGVFNVKIRSSTICLEGVMFFQPTDNISTVSRKKILLLLLEVSRNSYCCSVLVLIFEWHLLTEKKKNKCWYIFYFLKSLNYSKSLWKKSANCSVPVTMFVSFYCISWWYLLSRKCKNLTVIFLACIVVPKMELVGEKYTFL